MRTIVGLAALSAALWAFNASPAMAAENLGCVDAAMTDAQRDGIHATMIRNQPVDEAVFEIIRGCATQHGWSETAQRHAVMFTMGINLRRAMLRNAPLSPAQQLAAQVAFDSVFTEDESRTMLENDMSDAASERLGQAFINAGLPQDQATLEWLGGFLAATQMEKLSRIDFAGA